MNIYIYIYIHTNRYIYIYIYIYTCASIRDSSLVGGLHAVEVPEPTYYYYYYYYCCYYYFYYFYNNYYYYYYWSEVSTPWKYLNAGLMAGRVFRDMVYCINLLTL